MKTRLLAPTLQPFVDRGLIAGAVLLAATKDKVLAHEAIGYADLAAKNPMSPDNAFWIASMTKPMTCAALMMLVDEGKVNVNDPVEKYLPEFKGQMVIAEKDENHVLLKKPKHPILVREVLSHTSGLPFTSALETPMRDEISLRDAARSYAMTPLLFEPGTQYNYSNAGTNTAGRIIEVVSGLAYEDFMDQRLLGPLGMKETTFWPDKKLEARIAKAYHATSDKTGLSELKTPPLPYPLSDRRRRPMPAGGLFSVATDVVKFCQMFLNDGVFKKRRYLSSTAVKQMTRKQTGPLVEKSYGFGWDTAQDKYWHGGAFKTHMEIDRKRGLITVFLIHLTGDWAHEDGKKTWPTLSAAGAKLLKKSR